MGIPQGRAVLPEGGRVGFGAPLGSSFRDPAGYVFEQDGIVKRRITKSGLVHYNCYIQSGLHQELVNNSLTVNHREEGKEAGRDEAGLVIVPDPIPFISYPYEWCFFQLRDAALLTLELQERALGHGMTLKDASAYNVQFRGCRPVFIDTLSFEPDLGGAWKAYEQFCMHFLGPLALMQYGAGDWGRFLQAALEGLPMEAASRMLPWSSYLRGGLLLHVHMHARGVRRWAEGGTRGAAKQSPAARRAVIESLRRTIERMKEPRRRENWASYTRDRKHYAPEARASKKRTVEAVVRGSGAKMVYDLGANTGEYAKVAAGAGARCVAFDADAGCVEELYLAGRGMDSDQSSMGNLFGSINAGLGQFGALTGKTKVA